MIKSVHAIAFSTLVSVVLTGCSGSATETQSVSSQSGNPNSTFSPQGGGSPSSGGSSGGSGSATPTPAATPAPTATPVPTPTPMAFFIPAGPIFVGTVGTVVFPSPTPSPAPTSNPTPQWYTDVPLLFVEGGRYIRVGTLQVYYNQSATSPPAKSPIRSVTNLFNSDYKVYEMEVAPGIAINRLQLYFGTGQSSDPYNGQVPWTKYSTNRWGWINLASTVDSKLFIRDGYIRQGSPDIQPALTVDKTCSLPFKGSALKTTVFGSGQYEADCNGPINAAMPLMLNANTKLYIEVRSAQIAEFGIGTFGPGADYSGDVFAGGGFGAYRTIPLIIDWNKQRVPSRVGP